MASNVPLRSTSCGEAPTRPLPPLPSKFSDFRTSLVQGYENPTFLGLRPLRDPEIFSWSVAKNSFEKEVSIQCGSPVPAAQIYIETPATSIAGSGKRPGPRGVQWDPSNNRKYARLYSLSDANIDDIPLIMKDDKLKFKRRIVQEKSADNLGPRPNELRPSPKNPQEMFGRIKQSYFSKKYLEGQSRSIQLEQPNNTNSLKDGIEADLKKLQNELEIELSSSTLTYSEASSHEFVEALDKFAQNTYCDSEQMSTGPALRRGIRTSYESMQSLRRRMNEREARDGHNMREYSDEELQKYIFLKRLSIGSLPSHRSTASSLISKRTSDSLDFPTSIHQSLIMAAPIASGDVRQSFELPYRTSEPAQASQHPEKSQPDQPLHHLFEARRPIPTLMTNGISRLPEPAVKFTRKPRPSLGLSRIFGIPSPGIVEDAPQYSSEQRISDIPIFRVEGFPYVGPVTGDFDDLLNTSPSLDLVSTDDIFTSEATRRIALDSATLGNPDRFSSSGSTNSSSSDCLSRNASPSVACRPVCCVDRCRGDPRADKCPYCIYEVPKAHEFVRSLVELWKARGNVQVAWRLRQEYGKLDEVDGFGDTVLHLAASHGAGSLVLSWLINAGVDVHATNVVGQTFMHVLDPAAFAFCNNPGVIEAAGRSSGDTIALLLDTLKVMDFDFNAEDDFGQTPMHVLTRHEVHSYTLELAFHTGMGMGTSVCSKDFLGRSIESQIRTQSVHEYNWLVDPQREFVTNFLLQEMKPAGLSSHEQCEKLLAALDSLDNRIPRLDDVIRATAIKAAWGSPEIRYQGGNGLHNLAESCICLWIAASDRQAGGSQRKRKRQIEASPYTGQNLCSQCILSTAKKFLEVGVDPNQYDNHGNTPLMAFIGSDLSAVPDRKLTTDILQLLIDAGASVHRRNRKGETALHLAMRFGRTSAVEVLIENHANIHARARYGEGIVAVASRASHRAKRDGALYHRIITCMAIAGKYGAILGPSTKDEWDRQRDCVVKKKAT
ncbi:Ankyrin repeat and SOCS box 14 [Hyphodiscus hymeniophilus]|uniref:Ankyrin repeat and SOCS box 14 n=1 Tax=Hyphodiscus hymeniophilus TaxID=353542 RepID=A0A9P6VP46_9HELO|nr:Ankyrin repeat and SOCS box 14 [Hyphodiscus hymeniophilus]